MGFFNSLFGDRQKKELLDLIQHNTDMIMKKEGRTRHDAEYITICYILNDLADRTNGSKGREIIMEMLLNEYSQHHSDVMTYLAVTSGQITLSPEAEEAFIKRLETK